MAISFTQAPIVAAGDVVTSRHQAQRARAANDRLRSGVGDPTWRIHFYFGNLWRQVRNPSGSLFAPQHEFLQFYMHVLPENAEWPVTGPGDPEGQNLANPMMAFVHGDPNTPREDVRLSQMLLWDGGPPTTAKGKWIMGARQRGVYDPATGEQNVPAFVAAQDYFRIVQKPQGPHGRSYGGFMPHPEVIGDCNNDGGILNLKIFFTPLKDGLAVKEYAGSCPNGTANAQPNHINSLVRTPFAYYVILNNGQLDRLSVKDYIEGPYEFAGTVQKQPGDQLTRALNAFVMDFRGSQAQRDAGEHIRDVGFDFERFFGSQYRLAPARGHLEGGELVADYPTFTFTGATTIAAGTTSASHAFHSDFVFGGYIAHSEGLKNSVVIEILDGATVIGRISLEPGQDAVHWYDTGSRPDLSFRLANDAQLETAGGWIRVEIAELLDYQPEIHDAYMVLRMASTKGDSLASVDGRGLDFGRATEVGDAYFGSGLVLNTIAPGPPIQDLFGVNDNPVFDAARRFTRDHVRVVPRNQLVAYEVVDGKSILHFKRHAYGLDNQNPVDSFAGIADAIAHTAPAAGETNQWLMFVQTKHYHPSDSSIWKSDAFSDYHAWSNRCHVRNPHINKFENPDLLSQFLGTDAPEAPSGWNYAKGTNNLQARVYETEEEVRNFAQACRIYEPDVEIESAESYFVGGEERVKITYKQRLRHTDEAPAAIGSDVSGWDVDALRAEPYRTDENAIREYLVLQHQGIHCRKGVPGDSAFRSDLWQLPDDPMGACYPHFFFTHLVPEPYADSNDTTEQTDTKVEASTHFQMEVYLRAICEGYVDTVSSEAFGCRSGVSRLIDFTFENLCQQAFGGRWLSALPVSKRPDKPQGFGPLPNTRIWAEVLNHWSRAINLLTRARVMLPFRIQCRSRRYTGSMSVTQDWGETCALSGIYGATWSGSPPAANTLDYEDEWMDCSAINAEQSASMAVDSCDGDQYIVGSSRSESDVRVVGVDDRVMLSVPPALRSLIDTNMAFLATDYTTETTPRKYTVDSQAESQTCCFSYQEPCVGHFWDSDAEVGYRWDRNAVTATRCRAVEGGRVTADPLPSADLYVGRGNAGATCHNDVHRIRSLEVVNGSVETYLVVPTV